MYICTYIHIFLSPCWLLVSWWIRESLGAHHPLHWLDCNNAFDAFWAVHDRGGKDSWYSKMVCQNCWWNGLFFNLGTTCLDLFVFFHLKCFFQHLFLYIIQIRPRKHTTIFIIGCDLMMLVGGIVSAMFVPKAKVMLKYVSRVSESHFILFFCPPKISTRDREVSIYSVRGLRGCPSRYESNGIKLRFGFCHQSSSTLSWLLPCKWGSQWRFFDQAACLTWDSVSPPRWMLLKALWRKGPRTVVRSLLI